VSGILSLTFDDGPESTWTERVLDELLRWEVEATFFMVGERVRALPELARRVLEAGHDVQLHCDRHLRHSTMDEGEIERDADTALAALRSIGAAPTRWRTPWGTRTSASEAVAARLGLELVGWSIDTHDWRGDPAPVMASRATSRLGEGGTVLMHDGLGPGGQRADAENTVEAIGLLVGAARKLGVTIGPLRVETASGACPR
jgi:peptidoglycan/xylan/chitin deacetylase (PgdA/CDA1 family)